MASLKDKFIEGCDRQRHLRLGRAPALGGHGEGAGLLVQQGARRLLRAHLLPHRLAARAPPLRVHGRADQLGDEHEGPRPVLRQRLPRARDRGAAARRERVADRLRRRRRQDPLRAERRQGRRRARRAARSSARARRAARSSRSGTSPSASTRRSSTSARSSRSSSAARCPARGWGCSRCSSRRSPTGRSSRPTGWPARARSSTASSARPRRARRKHHPPVPAEEFEKPDLLRLEKETLGLYVSEHPLSALRAELRAKTDATIAELERRRDGESVTVGGIVSEVRQLDDQARRADGLPAPRRRHRRDRLRRLCGRLRRGRASSARPTGS